MEILLPVGAKSLAVVLCQKDSGKYFPKVNNLGKQNSTLYTEEFNKALLAERRKAIAPYHQFLTRDNYAHIDYIKIRFGTYASATLLERNMLVCMDKRIARIVNAFGGKEAHHIVEGTNPCAQMSRDILKAFGLDINHPVNGIFLPQDKGSIFKGTLHKTSHSKEYSQYVYQKISGAISLNELISALEIIKYDLFYGKIKLEGQLHSINKNDINV
ncbi:MAG TPA: hypothetical protein DF610_14160 [Sphingobacterium sp.]|nr:hypothetical protein FM120_28750 [Sphingobacterium faecium PCAi_F2.5]HCU45837.1 hypothetical protein [Sphingobacterium sp.]